MNDIEEKINQGKVFIQRVEKLSAGDLAILRRCNQNPLEDQRLFSTLGKLGILNRFEHALVACLYAVYHTADDKHSFLEKYNFGKAFRNTYDPIPKDPERLAKFKPKNDVRFRAILSTDKGNALAYRLRQAIRLLKSKDQPVDFSILLSDLFNWEKQDKWVQRKWVEGYYEGFSDNSDLPTDKDSDETIDETEEDNDDSI